MVFLSNYLIACFGYGNWGVTEAFSQPILGYYRTFIKRNFIKIIIFKSYRNIPGINISKIVPLYSLCYNCISSKKIFENS